MSGTLPDGICWILYEHFLRKAGLGVKMKPGAQRYILTGPKGNGKNKTIETLAKLMGAKFLPISAASAVNKLQGSGAQTMKDAFLGEKNEKGELIKDGVKQYLDAGKDVCLFIDEADCILSEEIADQNPDSYKAAVEFWTQIIEFEDNPHLHVFLATNKLTTFHENVTNRFVRNRIFNFINPTASNRKELIEDCYTVYYLPRLYSYYLHLISKELGYKEIGYEGLAKDLKNILKLVEEIDRKAQQVLLLNADQETLKKKIEALKEQIKKLKDIILGKLKTQKLANTNNDEQPCYATDLTTKFFRITNSYLEPLATFFDSNKALLRPEQVDYLVKESEGLPIRSIEYMMNSICEAADRYNNGVITIEMISSELKKAKQELKDEAKRWTREKQKKLEQLRAKQEVVATKIRIECPDGNSDCITCIKDEHGYARLQKDLNELLQQAPATEPASQEQQ